MSFLAPRDYNDLPFITITFPAGMITHEVPVQTVRDFINEQPEYFIAILCNPVGGELGSNTTATVNIFEGNLLSLCEYFRCSYYQ